MTNVIKFPEREDSDLFQYFKDSDGVLGVQDFAADLWIRKHYKGDSDRFTLNSAIDITHRRRDLAQFLWAAAYYIDSEQRYMPEGELIGINYED